MSSSCPRPPGRSRLPAPAVAVLRLPVWASACDAFDCGRVPRTGQSRHPQRARVRIL